jgi:hypothetical protein
MRAPQAPVESCEPGASTRPNSAYAENPIRHDESAIFYGICIVEAVAHRSLNPHPQKQNLTAGVASF